MIIGTAGHIDHGKTALVRALTGVDTDRLPEEKRRGITIELGFAPLPLSGLGVVGVVDVPGHEGFVRTMVAGASGVDLALLVIAADEGVMPQTREHLQILDLLAVRSGVVALTKADLVDEDWLALVTDDVRSVLAATVLANAPVVPTSTLTGMGVERLRDELTQALTALAPRRRDDIFRLPVDRAFTVKGTGTVVTGTLWSGLATADRALRLLPADQRIRVRGLQVHDESVSSAGPGSRVAVALGGIEVGDVRRGAVLVDEAVPWQPSSRLTVEVQVLPEATPIRSREWVTLHIGTSETACRLVGEGGSDLPPEWQGQVRLVTAEPVVARAGDRFVVRRSQPVATVAGGVVLDPHPTARLAPVLSGLSPDSRLRALLAMPVERRDGIRLAALPVRLGVHPADVLALLTAADCEQIGGRAYLRSHLVEITQGITEQLVKYHDINSIESGAPRSWLHAELGEPPELIDFAVERGLAAGALVVTGGRIALASFVSSIPDGVRRMADRAHAILVAAGREPPTSGELRQELGVPDLSIAIRVLVREGQVAQVEAERFYAVGVVADMVQALKEGTQAERVYSAAELRDILGHSRKYAIPFLEYCDRQGVTERRGEGRVVARDL